MINGKRKNNHNEYEYRNLIRKVFLGGKNAKNKTNGTKRTFKTI